MTEMISKPVDPEAALSTDITVIDVDANLSVSELVDRHAVMLFSKSTCPFCFGLKQLLERYGVQYTVLEIDKTDKAHDFQQQLFEKGGERTVPQLFVDGQKVGGCTTCKELQLTGDFQIKIAPYMTKEVIPEKRIKNFSFLYFPETVNTLAVRATGTLSMIYAVLCVAFYNHRATKWAVLAIAIDYLLRIVFGSGSSPIGMVGALLVSPFKPVFSAGQPKQFAACCGFFMTALSAALYLSGEQLGGVIMIALLIPPAGMEGLLNFCLGCWMFGIAIDLKLIPPTIYEPYISYRALKSWAYNFSNDGVTYPLAENEHVLLPGQSEPSPVDLIRKDRLEPQYKNQDYSVRHVTVDFFSVPMTAAALALSFMQVADLGKDSNPLSRNWGTKKVYQVLAIAAAVIFGLVSIAYLVRLFMWPKKACKEWRHPVYGNFFSAITISLTLLGMLLFQDALTFGITVVWIGSAGQLLITVLRVSDLIYDRIGPEMVTPALMMAPVGNFISALAFAAYSRQADAIDLRGHLNYIPVARLWFAVAAFFGIILFAVTFHKTMLDMHADPRSRPMLWIWMAAFSVAGPAYQAVSDSDGRDVVFQSLWLFSVFLCAVNGVGYLRGFYSYVNDLAIWVIAFSFCALSISTSQYNMFSDDKLTRILTIISLAIASASVAVCFTYTVMWAVDRSLFVARNKWGPVSFMKLTHEAFRFATPRLVNIVNSLSSTSNPVAVADFVRDLEGFFVMYAEHGNHEDNVLFPTLRRFHPGLNPSMDEEHEYEHNTMRAMQHAIQRWKDGEGTDSAVAGAMLDVLKAELPGFLEHLGQHMRNEEGTITVVARKYLTLEKQKEIANKVWDLTPAENWYKIVPYAIDNLPIPMWKVRYIKTFIWACPDRAQEVGLICYRTLRSVDWAFLSKEVPEIIPRGLPGWKRMY